MSIDVEIEKNVATVTINRPERKNAITLAMRSDIQFRFQELQDNPDVRAVILTGAGGNFCSGADVAEMGPPNTDGALTRMRLLHRMVRGVASTNKPVIAAISGVCVGVGWSLALASDFVIAADNARFQFAFRHIGLAPDGGAVYLLSRYVGVQRAKELVYSGRFVSGAEAAQLGLALEALPADDVLARATEMARDFAAAPTIALSMAKRQFDAAPAQDLEQALAFEANIQPLMVTTADFREGTTAFKEKRKPVYTGS